MNDANDVLWRRLGYFLTPQLTIYKNMAFLLEDKQVLEVGFGTGFGTLQYAHLAKSVTAVEIDRNAIQFANKVLPLKNVNWNYGNIVQGDIYGLYDAIVMIEVIEHIPEWETALHNVFKRLVPGGILIASTPNANGTFQKNPLHGDEWTAQQFRERLEMFFDEMRLYDFELIEEQQDDTRQTPLIAVCIK